MSLNFLNLFVNLALQQNGTFHQLYEIGKNRNSQGNACEDFYDYTCSRWNLHYENASYSETLGLIDYKVNMEMLKLIKSYEGDSNNTMGKMQAYLASCVNQNQRRLSSYLKIVKPSEDLDWPIFHETTPNAKEWKSEKFDWLASVAHLRRFGLNKVFLDQNVFQRYNDTKAFILDIDKPDLETRRTLPEQLKLMALLRSLGLPLSKITAMNNNLTSFELKLSNLQASEDDTDTFILTVAELRDEVPQLDWNRYLELLIKQNVSDDFILRIRSLGYFKALCKFLNDEDPKVICSYLMIHLMYHLAYDGSKSRKEADCVLDLRTKMDLAFQFVYYENFFETKSKIYEESVSAVFEPIRAEFRSRLATNNLKLNAEELKYFENKLNAMNLRIGNLPKDFNGNFIEKYYENIGPNVNDYVQNQLDLLELAFSKEHDRLTQPLKNIDEFFFIADKNAARSSTPFYYARLNAIFIPFGFLRPPLFDPESHEVFQWSTLGFNLAHEMAHGFDLNGILYDDQGRLNYEMSAAIEENAQYEELLKCLLETETSDINERFADFVGLQLTLDAFAQRRLHLDETVFGQPFMRAFFVNFAQFFCGSQKAQFIGHDTDKLRVDWALTQTDEYKAAFNCRKSNNDSKVNKCQLW